MPPEALELVEMLLDLAWSVSCPRVLHETENELFHGERGLSFIEGGPEVSPLRRQSSETEDVAVPGDPVAAIRWIGVTDESQQPHQREEGVAGDSPGAKRPVKLKAGTLLEDVVRSRRHAKLDVAVR